MSVKIRMTRIGREHHPVYRIVVIDSRMARDGRSIETIGRYQPLNPKQAEQIHLEDAQALAWLKKGAQPSETVKSILRKRGVLKQLHDFKVEQAKARKTA